MTIRECKIARKEDPCFSRLYGRNYTRARRLHKEIIDEMRTARPGVRIVLHHEKPGCGDYEKWEPVTPMYEDEHNNLHSKLKKGTGKYGVNTDDPAEYGRIWYASLAEDAKTRRQAQKREYIRILRESPEHRKQCCEYERQRRENATPEQRRIWAEQRNNNKKQYRQRETNEQREQRKAKRRAAEDLRRANETSEQRDTRLAKKRESEKLRVSNMTHEQREQLRVYQMNYKAARKTQQVIS